MKLSLKDKLAELRDEDRYSYPLEYCPEKLGLELVAYIEWTHRSYEFDLTKVWRKLDDGTLWYADDSGCSCPVPFEDTEELDRLFNLEPLEARYDRSRAEANDEWSEGPRESEWREFKTNVQAALDKLKG